MINCFIFQVSHKNLSWSKEGILSSHSLTIDPQNWPMTSSEKSWPTASFICELLVSIYVDRRHYFYLEWSQNELFATCHIQLVWGPLIFQGQQSRCSSVLLKMWQSRSSSPSPLTVPFSIDHISAAAACRIDIFSTPKNRICMVLGWPVLTDIFQPFFGTLTKVELSLKIIFLPQFIGRSKFFNFFVSMNFKYFW